MYIGTKVSDSLGRYEVEVLFNNMPQPLYRRGPDNKVFVAGIPGQPYTLYVRNLSGVQLEVVNAVDQRDTCSNSPASLSNDGMLVPAYGATTFDGWSHNDSEAGEFVFGEPSHSVSAQATGDTSKVGIIGFAAYAELQRKQSETFQVIARGGGSEKSGFVRAPGNPSILEIGYDTEAWLRKNGIIASAEPAAFPGRQAFGDFRRKG